MNTAKLVGVGRHLPSIVLTNHDLAKRVDTSDEWIQQRVGIKSRHIADKAETTASMAVEAAKSALEQAGLSADQLDIIIVATSTPDDIMPSTACSVQAALGIKNCIAFDVNAACSGFVYALDIVSKYFAGNSIRNALVIGSERMSRVMNWTDRSTCVLFGDGAGAAVFTASKEPGIVKTVVHSTGKHRELLNIPNNLPSSPFAGVEQEAHLAMEGNRVFRYAVSMLGSVVGEVLADTGFSQSDIDWLIPHQANARIIQATAKKLGLSLSQVILTLQEHGNTSAASIPLALAEGVLSGKVKPGELLLLEAFGAGFVWGASLIRY